MDLTKLIEKQRELDERIVREKGLKGQNLFPNSIIALQVELSEMANEARWFKHWSNDQEPRTKVACSECRGNGGYYHRFQDAQKRTNKMTCFMCGGSGFQHNKNPLLEEYADSTHFFLSTAIQKGWEAALYVYPEQLEPFEFDGGMTGIFLEMLYFINKANFENPSKEENEKWESYFGFPAKQYWFRSAWILFLNIGLHGFGFTLDQIEQAYIAKNEINHKRQSTGY